MPQIEFISADQNGLDRIKFLWEGLCEHHYKNSIHFKDRYAKMTFDLRKADLLKKLDHGKMRIDVAIESESKNPVGYCINTIIYEPALEGEIDSLFVHPDFRRKGIAEKLMKLAQEWFDSNKVTSRKIVVAAGNEEVFSFYEKFGFYHKFSTLENKSNY
jgi:ribosomal protein S18 acetylase RimI-like enzyme